MYRCVLCMLWCVYMLCICSVYVSGVVWYYMVWMWCVCICICMCGYVVCMYTVCKYMVCMCNVCMCGVACIWYVCMYMCERVGSRHNRQMQ